MPFAGDGLARSISQEHEAAAAELQRKKSSGTIVSKASFSPAIPTPSRPERIKEHRSESSSETANEEDEDRDADMEARRAEKEPQVEDMAAVEDPFLVTMKGREKELSPHHWGVGYRWFLTLFAGLFVLNATFASSAPSNLIGEIIEHYNVSQEVGILLISIFVAGYCVGPILWGPLSERYGRRKIFIVSFIPYTGFQVGCALSPNIGSLIVFRFLGGCFASSPLTASGALIADIWDADRRGDALAIFSLMPFAGPAFAPIVSGFMSVKHVDFRWIFWVLTIFAGSCALALIIFLPETYAPYILYTEAKRLRKTTGDTRWYAASEHKVESFNDVLHRTVYKPFTMIVQEPMLLVITLYMSFVYGVVYLLFEAVPIVFEVQHGLNSGESGLVFLALMFGGSLGVITYVTIFNPRYKKLHHQIAPRSVPPEFRLEPMMCAAPLLAVSFFWFAWTSYPSISIASPILAIFFIGTSILWIFLGCFNYIIDCYLANAASALAINTVCRSSFGAGFPLFATQMYATLGTPGAGSLLGGLAIMFLPVPFLLHKYGKKVRGMSKNAVVRADE